MLVVRASAPEAKHLGVIGLLLLQPEGQGLAQCLGSGEAPLAAEEIQLLPCGLGEDGQLRQGAGRWRGWVLVDEVTR